jgi:hypothetical protein
MIVLLMNLKPPSREVSMMVSSSSIILVMIGSIGTIEGS